MALVNAVLFLHQWQGHCLWSCKSLPSSNSISDFVDFFLQVVVIVGNIFCSCLGSFFFHGPGFLLLQLSIPQLFSLLWHQKIHSGILERANLCQMSNAVAKGSAKFKGLLFLLGASCPRKSLKTGFIFTPMNSYIDCFFSTPTSFCTVWWLQL